MKHSITRIHTLALMALAFTLTTTAFAQYTETVLYSFAGGTDGINPLDNVVFDTHGNLFGTTISGGTCTGNGGGGCGTVFELSPNVGGGWTESILYSFQGGNDGAYPGNGLIFDASGNLYGVTSGGGNNTLCSSYGCGVIFELSPNGSGGWTESVLYTFIGDTDGKQPTSNLLLDARGNLYGIANGGGTGTGCGSYGCGTVFELSPSSGGWSLKVLHTFTAGTDGSFPSGNLVFDAAGNMYGAATGGGGSTSTYCVSISGCGTIFRFSPAYNGRQFRVLYTFQGTIGFPAGSLAIDASGNLYGSTELGSHPCAYSPGCGAVFQLSPSTQRQWKLTLLHSFTGKADQYSPNPVILDSAGNLYGTTYSAPTLDGTAFELTPTSSGPWKYSSLYVFGGGNDGQTPQSNLIFDASGNLYGTTVFGGLGSGTVFELSPPAPNKTQGN